MLAFFATAGRFVALSHALRDVDIDRGLRRTLIEVGKKIKSRPSYELYAIREEHYHFIERASATFDANIAFSRFLPKMMLAALIARYDAFLAQLIERLFYAKPDMAKGIGSKLSFGELAAFSTMDEARQYVVEREAESVLRSSHDDQLKWFEDWTSIKVRDHIQEYGEFVELCERRNLLVHTDGRVSTTYLNNLKRHAVDTGELKAGDQLGVDQAYLEAAISVVVEVGYKLGLLCWDKFVPDEREKADLSIIHLSFELLLLRRFELVDNLLSFILKAKKVWVEDDSRLICVVNLAIAKRHAEDAEAANKILSTVDWSSTPRKFKVCVAAVRGDVEECVLQMRALGANDDITASSYKSWPAFESVRNDSRFLAACAEIYGQDALSVETQSTDVDPGISPS